MRFLKIKSMISFQLILLLVSVVTALQASELSVIQGESYKNTDCELTFGWISRKPLQFVGDNNQLQGLQIELVKSIGNKMQCKINFVEGSWQELVERIKFGEIDFMPGATITKARSKFANFSEAYRQDVFVIYVAKDKLDDYHDITLEEIKKSNFKLGLTQGFLYGDEIESWQSNNQLNHYLSYEEENEKNAQRLFDGEIDGFLEDPYVIAYNQRSAELKSRVSVLPLKVFGHRSSFMFSKKSVSLKTIEKFNLALSQALQLRQFKISWFEMAPD